MSAIQVTWSKMSDRNKGVTVAVIVGVLILAWWWYKNRKPTEGFTNAALEQFGTVFQKFQDVELNMTDTTTYLVNKYAGGDPSKLRMEMQEIDISDDSQLSRVSNDPLAVGIQFTTSGSKGFIIRAPRREIARDPWFSRSAAAYKKMDGSVFLLKRK